MKVTDQSANPNSEVASAWALQGVYVFPCDPEGKHPMDHVLATDEDWDAWRRYRSEAEAGDRWPGHRPGRGQGTGGFHLAVRDEATVETWWERWPDATVGVPILPTQVALDFDDDRIEGWPIVASARKRLRAARPDLADALDALIGPPGTPPQRTISLHPTGPGHTWTPGGEHVLFALPEGEPPILQSTMNGVRMAAAPKDLRRFCDVKGSGTGYIFAPESVRRMPLDRPWNRYALCPGDFADPAVIPRLLLAALRGYEQRRTSLRSQPQPTGFVSPRASRLARTAGSSRHDAMCAEAAHLAGLGHPIPEIEAALRAMNAQFPTPKPNAAQEIGNLAQSAVEKFGGRRAPS